MEINNLTDVFGWFPRKGRTKNVPDTTVLKIDSVDKSPPQAENMQRIPRALKLPKEWTERKRKQQQKAAMDFSKLNLLQSLYDKSTFIQESFCYFSLLLCSFTVLFYSNKVLLEPEEAKQASLISVFQYAWSSIY